MKRIFVIIVVLFTLNGPLDAQTPSTTIAFEERVYNFGTILEEKGKVSHTFVFENKGKTDITIDDVHSACGCIGKVITQGAIKAGKKGKVTITFDPGYKSGFFSKEIVVLSKGGQEYNRIWVEGVIKPTEHPIANDYPYDFGSGLHLRLKVMAFGYVKPGETKQMELHYANATDKEADLQFAADAKMEGLVFTNPGKIAPKAKGVIRFSYTMPANTTGDVLFKLFPKLNNKKLAQPVEIKILNDKNWKANKQAKQTG